MLFHQYVLDVVRHLVGPIYLQLHRTSRDVVTHRIGSVPVPLVLHPAGPHLVHYCTLLLSDIWVTRHHHNGQYKDYLDG